MKKLIIILATGLLCVNAATAQVGTVFPGMDLEDLKNSRITLPLSCKGKYTLVGMAMSREAEDHLRTWAQPVYDKFISKSKTDIWDEAYDIHLYFIPVFAGLNQAGYENARKQAIQQTDPDWHPHFLFYRGEFSSIRESLKMEDKSRPYFFILDPEGKIVYATSGSFTQKKMDEIQEFLDR